MFNDGYYVQHNLSKARAAAAQDAYSLFLRRQQRGVGFKAGEGWSNLGPQDALKAEAQPYLNNLGAVQDAPLKKSQPVIEEFLAAVMQPLDTLDPYQAAIFLSAFGEPAELADMRQYLENPLAWSARYVPQEELVAWWGYQQQHPNGPSFFAGPEHPLNG